MTSVPGSTIDQAATESVGLENVYERNAALSAEILNLCALSTAAQDIASTAARPATCTCDPDTHGYLCQRDQLGRRIHSTYQEARSACQPGVIQVPSIVSIAAHKREVQRIAGNLGECKREMKEYDEFRDQMRGPVHIVQMLQAQAKWWEGMIDETEDVIVSMWKREVYQDLQNILKLLGSDVPV